MKDVVSSLRKKKYVSKCIGETLKGENTALKT